MTEQTEGAEVVFDGHAYTYPDSFCECTAYVDGYADWRAHMAETLLASDWIAAREAAAEVRGAQAVLTAVEALHSGWHLCEDGMAGERWNDPLECDYKVEDPCETLNAARAAAAAAGGGGDA